VLRREDGFAAGLDRKPNGETICQALQGRSQSAAVTVPKQGYTFFKVQGLTFLAGVLLP
jgi:hypothetical protein